MFVHFLLVFGLLFILLRIDLWPCVGKEMSSWLFTCVVVIFTAVLAVSVPFPFGIWNRVWNSIVSVPDHCFFFYLLRHMGMFIARHSIGSLLTVSFAVLIKCLGKYLTMYFNLFMCERSHL